MIFTNQFLWRLNGTIIFLFVLTIKHDSVLAQISGQDSQQFFEQGNQLIEQQIQDLQREAREKVKIQTEKGEKTQQQQLEPEQYQKPKIEQSPAAEFESQS